MIHEELNQQDFLNFVRNLEFYFCLLFIHWRNFLGCLGKHVVYFNYHNFVSDDLIAYKLCYSFRSRHTLEI